MKNFFVSLWTDESRFIGLSRGMIMLLAECIRGDLIPLGTHGTKLAALLMVLAVSIPAGDKNPSTGAV
jgi:hypothetical protein